MRLLVTGGAGFIGSAVVRHVLRQTEHQVVNLDSLTYAANLDSLNAVLPNPRYLFEQADIRDAAQMRRVFETRDPDAVLHLAAESHVDRSIDAPRDFIETNVTGTFVLLEAARRHFERLTPSRKSRFRFVHVSTDEVFGSQDAGDPVTEAAAYNPSSPYAASKAASDMLVQAWHRTYGLPVVIAHGSNTYGPCQFPEKFIPVVILAASEGRDIPVYGNGDNIRDWLFVDDHAHALLAMVERGKAGESYNVGGGNQTQNIDLARQLCQTLDALLPPAHGGRHADRITFIADRPGHDRRYAVDTAKIRRELGWAPSTGLTEGLRLTVEWYLANRWWTDAIRARGFHAGRLGLGAGGGA